MTPQSVVWFVINKKTPLGDGSLAGHTSKRGVLFEQSRS